MTNTLCSAIWWAGHSVLPAQLMAAWNFFKLLFKRTQKTTSHLLSALVMSYGDPVPSDSTVVFYIQHYLPSNPQILICTTL